MRLLLLATWQVREERKRRPVPEKARNKDSMTHRNSKQPGRTRIKLPSLRPLSFPSHAPSCPTHTVAVPRGEEAAWACPIGR